MSDVTLLSLSFGIWLIAVSLVSGYGLFSIWIRLNKDRKKIDYGLQWLAFGVLVWVLGGLLVTLSTFISPNTHPAWLNFLLSSVSILNGAFILLALPYFEHRHPLIEVIFGNERVANIIIIWGAVLFVILTFVIALMSSGEVRNFYTPEGEIELPTFFNEKYKIALNWVSIPDWLFAVITTFCLLLMLFKTFEKREVDSLKWLSVGILVITMLVQTLKLLPTTADIGIFNGELNVYNFWHIMYLVRYIGGAIFMALLIMLFFALAYSSLEANAATKLKETVTSKDTTIQEQEEEIKRYNKEQKKLEGDNADLKRKLEQGNEQLVLIPYSKNAYHKTNLLAIILEIPGLLSKQTVNLANESSYKIFVQLINKRLHYEKETDEFLDIQSEEINRVAQDIVSAVKGVKSREKVKNNYSEAWRVYKEALFETPSDAGFKGVKGLSGYRLKFKKENIYPLFGPEVLERILDQLDQEAR